MLVKTKLKPSKIEGIGIFASESIKKGTIIWAFNPIIDKKITKKEFDSLPKIGREYLENYCYINKKGECILCGDNAKFFNHSESPNTIDCQDTDNEEIPTIASKDISIDEEIVSDYRLFDSGFKMKLKK